MSQEKSSSSDPAPPLKATGADAANQRSPLTTPVNQYGTMEFSEIPNQNTYPSQQHASMPETSETPIGPPQPAVRRKILQPSSAPKPENVQPSSEKMLAINETIQAIDEQRSSLSKTAPTSDELREKGATNDLAGISLNMKRQTQDDPSLQTQHQTLLQPTRPYPKKVFFIVANEFCERFSYYGLRALLVLYFKSVLGFSDSGSTVSFHLFATLCYVTPIFGAILGDTVLGKYKTILYLSGVYLLGEIILAMSSIFWDLGTGSTLITWFGLVLICFGTGGIKPCVVAFAGDQFLPNESKWREGFFSLFYGAINLGSLLSMFITPILRSNYSCFGRNDCYPYAFGLPCLLLFIATAVFLLARDHYYIAPLPEQNIIVAFCQCTWLAIKRKMSGQKLPPTDQLTAYDNQTVAEIEEDSSSSSRVSMSSSENEAKPVAPTQKNIPPFQNQLVVSQNELAAKKSARRRTHWLYLSSDRFGANLIEEFRAVLGILLIFLPTPVYWCLFDQQGSLWTLQATRMDGKIFGTSFVLHPDQMMVANPVLLLTAIPIFQFVIYPALDRCKLVTTPIQRITTGGFLAALSFVASALIEFKLQANEPHLMPMAGHTNLLLVNGLSECSLDNATIYLNQRLAAGSKFIESLNDTGLKAIESGHLKALRTIDSLDPLRSERFDSLPISNVSSQSYTMKFKLANQANSSSAIGTNRTAGLSSASVGCPFDPTKEVELVIAPLPSQAVRLLYIDQGNGKLNYKLFNESLALPPSDRARVRLLYEFFGSYSKAQNRTFYLTKSGSSLSHQQPPAKELTFRMSTRDGQVLLSDYLDVEITPSSSRFYLLSSDSSLNMKQAQPIDLKLDSGTRNLLILHQMDASNVKLTQELLQDNKYRISILYQLIPYAMISMSEVMFSITILEFSYAMAPPNMRSLILGCVGMTTALGNLLTVLVEAVHPFSNIGHDFLFYAALMAADMILFGYLGYHFEPYQSSHNFQSESQKKD